MWQYRSSSIASSIRSISMAFQGSYFTTNLWFHTTLYHFCFTKFQKTVLLMGSTLLSVLVYFQACLGCKQFKIISSYLLTSLVRKISLVQVKANSCEIFTSIHKYQNIEKLFNFELLLIQPIWILVSIKVRIEPCLQQCLKM